MAFDKSSLDNLKKTVGASSLDDASETKVVGGETPVVETPVVEATTVETTKVEAPTETPVETKKEEAPKQTRKAKEEKEETPVKKFSEILGSIGAGDVVKRNETAKGSPLYELQVYMSTKAQITGFIKNQDTRQDIVVAKNTSGEYDVMLKEKSSRTVRGVIFKYPKDIANFIHIQRNKVGGAANSEYADGVISPKDYEEGLRYSGTPVVYLHEILNLNDFTHWMTKFCWQRIQEAPEIYWKHRKYKKITQPDGSVIVDYEIIDRPDKYGAEYYLESKAESAIEKIRSGKLKRTPQTSDFYALKSSYRGTNLTVEGNYIAIEKFKTVKLLATYDAEKAAKYNRMYVEAAFGSKDTFEKRVSSLSEKAKDLVTSTRKNAFASKFFNENGSILRDKTHLEGVKRYYDKNQHLTPSDVKLVAKDIVTTKNGNQRVVYEKIAFGATGNTLDNPEYSMVRKANAGFLTDAEILAFIDSQKKSKKSATRKVKSGIEFDVQPLALDLLEAFKN